MISINCPKCGKHFELEDKLKWKEWRCTCWTTFEITDKVSSDELQIISTPWKYVSESIDFIKKNFLYTIIIPLVVGIIFATINNYYIKNSSLNWISWILNWLVSVLLSLSIIAYIQWKKDDNNYSYWTAIKVWAKKILYAIIWNILTGLIMLAFLLPLIIWWIIAYVSFATWAKDTIWAFEITWLILILIWIVTLIYWVIFLLRYSFLMQNIVINWLCPIQAMKNSSKQTYWLKWKIFLINLSILWIMFVFWLILWISLYMFKDNWTTKLLQDIIIEAIAFPVWAIWIVVITKLFNNINTLIPSEK